MDSQIRNYTDNDLEEIVELSLLAWAPVFTSFQQVLGKRIYSILYPDWRQSQKEAIEGICRNKEKYITLVTEVNQQVVGFLVYELKTQEKTGEVILLAVHPEHQNHGLGTELNKYALSEMRFSGIKMAIVETGGDESHNPARKSYEKAGFTAMPIVRYFKDL